MKTAAVLGAVLAIAAGTSPAGAAPAGIVLVSVEGSGDRTRDIEPLLRELQSAGFVVGDKLETLVHEHESLPGVRLSPQAVEHARQLIENGYAAFVSGEFDTALDNATAGLDQLLTRPATAAEDASIRDDVFKALVVRAMAMNRKDDALGARGAMEELLRSFPDRELSLRDYGPEAVGLYRKASAKLDAEAKGALRVVVDDDAAVFINERYAGRKQIKERVPAGSYRVYIQLGQGVGRVHRAHVRANEETVLTVDGALDRAIRTGRDAPVGFSFESAKAREKHEVRFARRLGKRLAAHTVVVIGLRDYRGKPAVIGSVVDVERGEVRRVAAIVSSGGVPSEDEQVALARFLSAGQTSEQIQIIEPGTDRPLEIDSETSVWPAAVIGGGIAGVLAGGGLLIATELSDCDSPACDTDTKRIIGVSTLGVGAVALGVGLYALWSRDSVVEGVAVAPARGGLSVSFGGRF